MTTAEIEERLRIARGQKLPLAKLLTRTAAVAVPFVVVFMVAIAALAPALLQKLAVFLGSGIGALFALAVSGLLLLLAVAWLVFPLIVWWQLDQILKALRSDKGS
jgi:hypothetical protein